jgi:2'-5' RNA ligase
MQPFELVVSGSGAFPPRGRPSVLWIGIEDPAGQLAILHRAIESECAALGFAKEARAYHPHLTVARLRQPQQSRPLASAHQNLSFSKRPFTISEVVLFRSELLKQGSRHTALSRHKLG